MSISPTAEGFRAAFRQPSVALAEISWRWVTGACATAVFFFGLVEYLKSLPVTSGELLFLKSRQPYLIGQAIAHILRGSLNRVALAALLAILLLGLFWIVAGSVGRITTVRALLEYFRSDASRYLSATGAMNDAERELAGNVAKDRLSVRGLFRLNFWRAIAAMAAVLGFVGASIVAGFVSTDANPRPGLAFLLFLLLAALICIAWSGLNWWLSLASMFAVRDGSDAGGAISAAVSFCRERAGAVSAVSVWTWLAHLVVLVGGVTIISMPLGLAAILPWRVVLFVTILVALAYFAVADWLYTARLAGYVCIAEMPKELLKPSPPPQPMPRPSGMQAMPEPAVQTAIDRDEVILSDVTGSSS
jgi:hypothetical protein